MPEPGPVVGIAWRQSYPPTALAAKAMRVADLRPTI